MGADNSREVTATATEAAPKTKRQGRMERLRAELLAKHADLTRKKMGFNEDGTLGAMPDAMDLAFNAQADEVEGQLEGLNAATLEQVEAALARMSAGTYGLCVACMGNILSARLEAMPFAPNCIPCQLQSERDVRSGRRDAAARTRAPVIVSDDDELDEPPVSVDAVAK